MMTYTETKKRIVIIKKGLRFVQYQVIGFNSRYDKLHITVYFIIIYIVGRRFSYEMEML